MTKPLVSDVDFVRLFNELGASKLATKLGTTKRAVFFRRSNLENRLGTPLVGPPNYRNTRVAIDPHEPRLHFELQNGVMLVGSDAHIWPGKPSTGMRAFLKFVKDLQPSVIVMNGDVLDFPQISRHPPIGHQNLPDVQEEIECAQDQLYELEKSSKRSTKLVWTLGNHDCLDSETECLTQKGWKHYTELKSDDLILSKKGEAAVWNPINEIVSFPFDGELVCVDKLRISMAVTPNHRVLLKRHKYAGNYKYLYVEEYIKAENLPSSFDVSMTSQIENPDISLTDDQLSLAGWILTDGCFGQHDISIYQSKEVGKKEIERILTHLKLEYSVYEHHPRSTSVLGKEQKKPYLVNFQYYIKSEGTKQIKEWLPQKKRLPEWAYRLSKKQFAVFLDAFVAGDGMWDGPRPECKELCVVYGTKEILSDLQAVAVTHAWRTRLYQDTRGNFRLWLSKRPTLRIEKKEINKQKYKGIVWCLRVPQGNFLVRRKGTAYFTGNSRFETRLATVAPEFARLNGHSLKNYFPAWLPCWSTWINNSVVIKHRFKGGIHAPHNNTMWAGKTMITGHLHSAKVVPYTDYNGTRYGVDTGCLADPNAAAFLDYTEDNPKNWRQAFCVFTFYKGKLLQPELALVWDEKHVEFRGRLIGI